MSGLSALFLIVCFTVGKGQHYIPIDEPGAVTFNIKNLGLNVEGKLTGIKGKIVFYHSYIEKSSFEISMNASSVDTGIELRDRHLRKEEYLDTDNYPIIQFVSAYVKASTGREWIVGGALTIKNKTKQIQFPFTAEDNGKVKFKGQFRINRKDFDVGGKSLSMSDSVTIYLNVIASEVSGN